MSPDNFQRQFHSYFEQFRTAIASESGDWVVKGFIDVYRNIYTISADTKVVSKIVELMLFPLVSRFAAEFGYKMVLSQHQNHYPDVTFVAADETKIALDLKSTYRIDEQTVNGFTLGAFTGYFRQRKSNKNITFPYEQYAAHFVFGVIYTRTVDFVDERKTYSIDDLLQITSVARDFAFLFQEKWRIATDRPGSGNTKNIGSVTAIQRLMNGDGSFTPHGLEVFDDYWMNYLTADMARAIDSTVPYHNLSEYFEWRGSIPWQR